MARSLSMSFARISYSSDHFLNKLMAKAIIQEFNGDPQAMALEILSLREPVLGKPETKLSQ